MRLFDEFGGSRFRELQPGSRLSVRRLTEGKSAWVKAAIAVAKAGSPADRAVKNPKVSLIALSPRQNAALSSIRPPAPGGGSGGLGPQRTAALVPGGGKNTSTAR